MATNQPTENRWNRLWDTITYFDVIPGLNSLVKLFDQSKTQDLEKQQQLATMGLILVIGATGGVGKRIVKLLLDNNYTVRALVRDANKAKEILPEAVQLFPGDLTLAGSLTPSLLKNVTTVIDCSGVKVQPVEGDTPDRAKYYQGVKFYLPEVADSPEMVEYQGIKNLMTVVKQNLRSDERLLFDFTNPNQDIQAFWGALDDVVMGGVSASQIRLANQRAIFCGNVSTDNNGGFASVRSRNFPTPLDLSEYQGISLKLSGDGQRYKFIIRCEGQWDGIAHCYSFDTIYNYPQTVDIPFSALIPTKRAKTVGKPGSFDPSRVYSLQLMLSKFEYDGQLNPRFSPGLFGLEVESISAYGKKVTNPQYIQISSAGVTRPGRPDLDLEQEPPAVKLNEQLGGILTWKLAGEEIIRHSGLRYTIIRPCALTENPATKQLVFAQGDEIKGQVSREAIAQLCLEVLHSPEAVNKTFEVKETDQPITNINYRQLLAALKTDC